jgi:hypothetical protein
MDLGVSMSASKYFRHLIRSVDASGPATGLPYSHRGVNAGGDVNYLTVLDARRGSSSPSRKKAAVVEARFDTNDTKSKPGRHRDDTDRS